MADDLPFVAPGQVWERAPEIRITIDSVQGDNVSGTESDLKVGTTAAGAWHRSNFANWTLIKAT